MRLLTSTTKLLSSIFIIFGFWYFKFQRVFRKTVKILNFMKFPMKNEKYMLKNCMLIMHMHFLRYLSLAFLLQYIAKKAWRQFFNCSTSQHSAWAGLGLDFGWLDLATLVPKLVEQRVGKPKCSPSRYLLGRVRLGMLKQLIGPATAGACPNTWLGRPNRARPSRNVGNLKRVGSTWACPSSAHVALRG